MADPISSKQPDAENPHASDPKTGPETGADAGPDTTPEATDPPKFSDQTDLPDAQATVVDVDPDDSATSPDQADGEADGEATNDISPETSNETMDEPVSSQMPEHSSDSPPETPPERPRRGNGGKGGMLLAGFATAAFGFGAGWLSQKPILENLTADFTAQKAALAELDQRLDALPADQIDPIRQELSALDARLQDQNGRIDQLSNDLEDQQKTVMAAQDELSTQLDERLEQARSELGERIDAVEMIASGGQADANSAGEYVRRVEERLSTLEQNADALTRASDNLRAEADAAEAAAQLARARAGLAQINTALVNGDNFETAIPAIEVIAPVPEPLKLASLDGVPTINALRADYVSNARRALELARETEASGEPSNGLGSLFRKQLNIRSTVPRAGESVDAILSRVEASLWNDELAEALTELKTLPPEPRAVFADWIALAELRKQSLDAVADLSQTLNQK